MGSKYCRPTVQAPQKLNFGTFYTANGELKVFVFTSLFERLSCLGGAYETHCRSSCTWPLSGNGGRSRGASRGAGLHLRRSVCAVALTAATENQDMSTQPPVHDRLLFAST